MYSEINSVKEWDYDYLYSDTFIISVTVCLTSTAQTVFESDKDEVEPVLAALFVPHKTQSEKHSISQIEWQRKSQLYYITDKQVKFSSYVYCI